MVSGDIASVLKPPAARCFTWKTSEPLWTQSLYLSYKHGGINAIQEFTRFPDLEFYYWGSVFSTYAWTEHTYFSNWPHGYGSMAIQICSQVEGKVIHPSASAISSSNAGSIRALGPPCAEGSLVQNSCDVQAAFSVVLTLPWHIIFAFCFNNFPYTAQNL